MQLECFDMYDALIMCCNILFGVNAAPDWPWLTWLELLLMDAITTLASYVLYFVQWPRRTTAHMHAGWSIC
jgi:hypothetical protein